LAPDVNLDPQIAVTVVAILGALSHAVVAVLRAVQDYRVALLKAAGPQKPVTHAGAQNGPLPAGRGPNASDGAA
jgi:hypothetical protein